MNERLDKSHHVRPIVAELLRRLALGLVAALLVARPLVVSEDAAEGSGLWFAQLWLGATVLWALGQVARGSFIWHFHRIDLAILVLVLAVAMASVRAAAVRPAINMAWEWVGLACIYFLVRQLPQSAAENRGLAVVVFAMAVALSGYSLYEYVWVQPRTKADYLADRERSLRQLGIEPGTADARRFEDRLLFTHEPLATFANTNSLAGFVLPWFIVGLACALPARVAGPGRADSAAASHQAFLPARRATPGSAGAGSARSRPVRSCLSPAWRFAWILALLLMAVCLFLTKSRAAWTGALAGIALWLFLQRRNLSRRARAGLLVGLVLVAATVTALVTLGRGFDHFLVTTAVQAVVFRAQYWQGAWGIIRDHPWLGVGPGNFQQHYMAHKLPTSSEEIADPHNLLLELWSTAGIFAAAALAVALGAFVWNLWRAVRRSDPEAQAAPGTTEPASPGLDRLFLAGGIGGFLLVTALGLFMLIPAEASGSVVIILLAAWLPALLVITVALRGARLAPAALLAAVVALTVSLLGAGGIAFPAVAQNVWLLVALGLNAARPRAGARHGPLLALPAAVLTAATFAAAYVTATGPVTACNTEMNSAAWHLQSRNVRTAVGHLEEAIRRDRLSPKPLQILADILFQQSRDLRAVSTATKVRQQLHQQVEERFQAGVELARLAIERDPHRPSMRWWLARQYMEHYFATGDRSSAQSAADSFERCLELYPTNAAYQVASAEALRLVGRDPLAAKRLERALELLAATPHQDKRIEVLEVLRDSARRHPQSPLRRAELADGLWRDANWFKLDPPQMQSKRAEARRVAQAALRLNESDRRTETLTPEWLERLGRQIDSP